MGTSRVWSTLCSVCVFCQKLVLCLSPCFCLMLDFSVSFLSEVSQQTARNNPSSYQIKAAAAASSSCAMASSSTCTSARRRVETLDSTARTRPQLHVRPTHLDHGDGAFWGHRCVKKSDISASIPDLDAHCYQYRMNFVADRYCSIFNNLFDLHVFIFCF